MSGSRKSSLSGGHTASSQLARKKKLRAICLSFPEAEEAEVGGLAVFRVDREDFAAVEERQGKLFLALRVGPEDLPLADRSSRLPLEKHLVKKGWVELELKRDIQWDEVRDVVLVAFVSVAPKRMLQALERTLTSH